MKIRNILTFTLLAVTTFVMTGCLDDGSLSTVEYNNAVVDVLNSTSAIVEDTTTLYDESVPNIVTEESEVDVTEMSTSLAEAKTKLLEAATVLDLVSKNSAQQESVTAEFQNYLDLGNAYLATYETVVTYYSTGEYKENLDLVAEYDESLHTGYNDFIASNNNLVDILAGFIE